MSNFFKKIFSFENHFNKFEIRVKVIRIFGLQFEIPIYKKLKPLNKFHVDCPPVYLSIVSIAKNEGPYIKEWIEYHKLVGVERFYFYDNESTDNTREVLEPYIQDGTVIYNYIKGKCLQVPAYIDAIVKYKNQTRWMAIIDLDEYIVPTEKDNIPDFLKDYEKYPAVGLNWVMFDSNGHKTKPISEGGLVTANYTRVMKNYDCRTNCHIKSIVDPKKVIAIYNPHYAEYEKNQYAVNENFEVIYGVFTNSHSSQKIRINHYHSKSKEEYIQKTQRGNADSTVKRTFFDTNLNFPEYSYDYVMQKYIPDLKKRMNISEGE